MSFRAEFNGDLESNINIGIGNSYTLSFSDLKLFNDFSFENYGSHSISKTYPNIVITPDPEGPLVFNYYIGQTKGEVRVLNSCGECVNYPGNLGSESTPIPVQSNFFQEFFVTSDEVNESNAFLYTLRCPYAKTENYKNLSVSLIGNYLYEGNDQKIYSVSYCCSPSLECPPDPESNTNKSVAVWYTDVTFDCDNLSYDYGAVVGPFPYYHLPNFSSNSPCFKTINVDFLPSDEWFYSSSTRVKQTPTPTIGIDRSFRVFYIKKDKTCSDDLNSYVSDSTNYTPTATVDLYTAPLPPLSLSEITGYYQPSFSDRYFSDAYSENNSLCPVTPTVTMTQATPTVTMTVPTPTVTTQYTVLLSSAPYPRLSNLSSFSGYTRKISSPNTDDDEYKTFYKKSSNNGFFDAHAYVLSGPEIINGSLVDIIDFVEPESGYTSEFLVNSLGQPDPQGSYGYAPIINYSLSSASASSASSNLIKDKSLISRIYDIPFNFHPDSSVSSTLACSLNTEYWLNELPSQVYGSTNWYNNVATQYKPNLSILNFTGYGQFKFSSNRTSITYNNSTLSTDSLIYLNNIGASNAEVNNINDPVYSVNYTSGYLYFFQLSYSFNADPSKVASNYSSISFPIIRKENVFVAEYQNQYKILPTFPNSYGIDMSPPAITNPQADEKFARLLFPLISLADHNSPTVNV